MKTRLPLELTYTGRAQLRDSYADWFRDLHFKYFATLNCNREITPNGARKKFGNLLAFIDRSWLGYRWSELSQRDRTFAIAIMEHPETNLHLHVLLRAPDWPRPRNIKSFRKLVRNHWAKLMPQGSCDCQRIYDQAGVGGYFTKDLARPGHLDNLIISSEFHRISEPC